MKKINIKLCLGDHVDALYRSLKAEETQPAPEKGIVNISIENKCLNIEIISTTFSGLRALTNSFLLLIHASYSAIKASEEATRI